MRKELPLPRLTGPSTMRAGMLGFSPEEFAPVGESLGRLPIFRAPLGMVSTIVHLGERANRPLVNAEQGDDVFEVPQGAIGYSEGAYPCLIILTANAQGQMHIMHAQGDYLTPEQLAALAGAIGGIGGGDSEFIDAYAAELDAANVATVSATYDPTDMESQQVFSLVVVRESFTEEEFTVPAGIYFEAERVRPELP